jgi:hypothetical protein
MGAHRRPAVHSLSFMDDAPRDTQGLQLALQSDPPWLTPAIGGVAAASLGAFLAIFAAYGIDAPLGLLPGTTVAVFVGSALAVWARRGGGSAWLQLRGAKLVLRERGHRVELVDLAAPSGASLLVDVDSGRRLLVLSQQSDPVLVLEGEGPAPGAARAAPSGFWAGRTVRGRLDALALSASTAHVYGLARGESLDALLDGLAAQLDDTAPWMTQHLGAGAVLSIEAEGVSLGARVLPRQGLQLLAYALQAQGGRVAALGFGHGEGALVLVGCEEAAVARDAVTGDLSPDGFVSPAVFEVLPLLAGPSEAAAVVAR